MAALLGLAIEVVESLCEEASSRRRVRARKHELAEPDGHRREQGRPSNAPSSLPGERRQASR